MLIVNVWRSDAPRLHPRGKPTFWVTTPSSADPTLIRFIDGVYYRPTANGLLVEMTAAEVKAAKNNVLIIAVRFKYPITSAVSHRLARFGRANEAEKPLKLGFSRKQKLIEFAAMCTGRPEKQALS
jgi:hypothetical protein